MACPRIRMDAEELYRLREARTASFPGGTPPPFADIPPRLRQWPADWGSGCARPLPMGDDIGEFVSRDYPTDPSLADRLISKPGGPDGPPDPVRRPLRAAGGLRVGGATLRADGVLVG